MEKLNKPKGLAGWLILPAIGLLASPLVVSVKLYNNILPVFQGNTWALLTTPGTELYHPLYVPLLIFEIVSMTFLLIFNIILIPLFFSKSYRLPRLMIIFFAVGLLVLFANHFLIELIPLIAEKNSIVELYRPIFWSLIWIWYFLVSKRVRNTFTKSVVADVV